MHCLKLIALLLVICAVQAYPYASDESLGYFQNLFQQVREMPLVTKIISMAQTTVAYVQPYVEIMQDQMKQMANKYLYDS